MKISGCVLAKNEEENIRGCLDCLKELTDNIIFVDNGSEDKTVEIAKEYNVLLIESKDTYIDEARNMYLEAATHPWVLILDADERIMPEYKNIIQSAIENADESIKGFYLPRFEYIGDGKWSEIKVARLIRNDPNIRYNNFKIHSSLTPSIVFMNGRMDNIWAPIHHFDILMKNRTSAKREMYIKQIQWEIDNNKSNPFIWTQYVNMGVELMAIERFKEAVGMFEKSIALNDRAIHFSTIYKAQSYLFQGMYEHAVEECQKLIDMDSHFKDRAFLVLADIEVKKGYIDNAIKYCETNISLNPNSPHNYLNLVSLIESSHPVQALKLLDMSIKMNPYLVKKEIYTQGERPNLFYYQSSFLSSYEDVFKHYIKCYEYINDLKNANKWREVRTRVLG